MNTDEVNFDTEDADFLAMKKLLEGEEQEEMRFDGPLSMNPNCVAPGPPTAPGVGLPYPTGRSTESMQMIYQNALPGLEYITSGIGMRTNATTVSMFFTPNNNLNIVAAYLYWNVILAADSVANFQFLDGSDANYTSIQQNAGPFMQLNPSAYSAGVVQTVGIANNTCWQAFDSGNHQDGGTPPQNIINVVNRADLRAMGVVPATFTASTTYTYNMTNLPIQTGATKATAASDTPYYPQCKNGQGAVIIIVYQDPTKPAVRQVTVWDGAVMLAPSSGGDQVWQNPTNGVGQSPASGQYALTYNSKYILQPQVTFAVGDAQTLYPHQALVNGAPINNSNFYFTPNDGNLLSLKTETNTLALQANQNTFAVYSPPPSGDCMAFFMFAISAGDPHFVGFRGERFDFHGHAGKFYNLLSDENIQVNAYFGDWRTNNEGWTATRRAGITVWDQGIYKVTIDAEGYVGINNFEFKSNYMTFGTNSSIRLIQNYEDLGHKDIKEFDGFGDFIRAYEVRTLEYRIIFIVATDHHNGYYLNFLAEVYRPDLRPHGIVGQTTDDSIVREPIPYAIQGEGTIEGVYTDYEVVDLFAKDFKFNKFNGDKVGDFVDYKIGLPIS